jgi:membrane-bound metal-dependent hydrolase YbcI (DUF457 family)
MFATAARLRLGHWPSYDHPDPTDLHMPWLDMPFLPLVVCAPLVPLIYVAIAVRRWRKGEPDWNPLLVALASFAGLALWVQLDPGGFIEWWLD